MEDLNKNGKDQWSSKIGVILAVAGSAVGLGNFLRFPGLAAQYGGGIFLIPYFTAFLLLGLPLAWMEWSLGRYGGRHGYNSVPGIYHTAWRHPVAPYLGVLGVVMPVMLRPVPRSGPRPSAGGPGRPQRAGPGQRCSCFT